jgi:aspartate racemase
MKPLGIVGGIGPESTVEYYRFILDGYRGRVPDGSAPHLIIDSLDVNRAIAMLDANDLAGLTNYLSASVERLARAGAEIALLAANTPHLVFDEVQRRSPIPMLSIVQAACEHVRALEYARVGLLGTGFTMRARFYPEVFARAGVELIAPNEAEQAAIHTIYIGELLRNQFLSESRNAILAIIERLRAEKRVEAILLAGTELPLLLRDAAPEDIPLLDTTVIHVGAAVDAILAGAAPAGAAGTAGGEAAQHGVPRYRT